MTFSSALTSALSYPVTFSAMLTTQGQYNNGDDDGDYDDYDDEHGDDGGRTHDDAYEDKLADDADRG